MPRSVPSLPSLQQLRVFDAVANLESFSAAAKTIHLSQPSVTLAIRHLEGKVGAALFDRRQTGCYVTSAGAIFLPRVTRMRSQIRQALCEPIVGQPFVDRSSVTALERKITDTQVRSLIAISESVSFDEAARRIEITEPSLHRSARTLERILRRTLYRRTAQGYTTTPPATELARRFKVAAREIEYGMDEIAAEHGPFVSRIVVGNIPHSDTHLLSAAINELLAKFPQAAVDVLDGHYSDLLNALRHGSVDIVYGVLRRPRWAFDIEERFLFSNRYAVVARRDHPIRTLRRITTSELARYDWIMPPKGTPRRHAFEQIFKERKIQPKVSVETTSMEIYRALLGTSDRLSLFSHREADTDRTAGFEALPYRSPSLKRDDGIALRRDWKPTKIHLEFLERLAAFAAIRG
jgi:LysR family transcriptional regulator, regulator for genes of the gallate degradation pathway